MSKVKLVARRSFLGTEGMVRRGDTYEATEAEARSLEAGENPLAERAGEGGGTRSKTAKTAKGGKPRTPAKRSAAAKSTAKAETEPDADKKADGAT